MNFLLWRVAGVGGLMPRNEVLAAEDGVPWDDIAGVGGLKMGLVAVAASLGLIAHYRPSIGRDFVDMVLAVIALPLCSLLLAHLGFNMRIIKSLFHFRQCGPFPWQFFDEMPRKFRLSIFII